MDTMLLCKGIKYTISNHYIIFKARVIRSDVGTNFYQDI